MGLPPEEKCEKGEVVLIRFPFSDLSNFKIRPALVIANLEGEDVMVCQISSKERKDSHAVLLSGDNFQEGRLRENSSIRPNKIFTASKAIVFDKVGRVKKEKTREVENKIVEIITT
jgi:mRNA interferase MazF